MSYSDSRSDEVQLNVRTLLLGKPTLKVYRTQVGTAIVDDRVSPTSNHRPEAESQLVQWTPEEKRAIAARVEAQVKLLKFCLETAKTQFSGLVESEESIRCLATTLYLSALQ